MATQAPLEQLREMTAQVGKTRRKSPRRRDPTAKVEKFYRRQLRGFVRELQKIIEQEVVPVVKREEAEYQIDSDPVDLELARAARETDPAPEPESAERGDYDKGRLQLRGFTVVLESPAGALRKGQRLRDHYGYLEGVPGADGDDLDVFIGPHLDSSLVYVVDQLDRDGGFDEHKVLLGFRTMREARSAYLDAYEPGWRRLGALHELSWSEFVDWALNASHVQPLGWSMFPHRGEDARPTYTADGWASDLLAALSRASDTVSEQGLRSQYERLAQRTVSMAESESTDAFLKSVNEAVGVDLSPMLDQEGMQEYVEAATAQNARLIRSVEQEYLDRVENAVLGGVRDGDSPSKISARIQEATGVTRRQADRIARDQTAKLTSEITERRQRNSGIKYYRSVDSGDRRVTGRPDGKYPNAKISCWGIARRDIGYGPGVYRWDQGASWGGQTGLHPGRHHINCRCTATPVFEWEIPNGGGN